MRLEPEWQLAKRIALLVATTPGRGMRRDELLERLGMPWVDAKPSMMLAYKRGGIDFCRDYVIAPMRRSGPGSSSFGTTIEAPETGSGDIPDTPRQDTLQAIR